VLGKRFSTTENPLVYAASLCLFLWRAAHLLFSEVDFKLRHYRNLRLPRISYSEFLSGIRETIPTRADHRVSRICRTPRIVRA
jgi:hypothetical protein